MFSVLLSTYKTDNPLFLEQALDSICFQQSLVPGQIVVVKDGPLTEELDSVIENFREKLSDKFTVVSLKNNVGLGAALNEGLKYCEFELVARMDSDDISLRERFSIQVAFMVENPDVVASSATFEEFDEGLITSRGFRSLPKERNEIVRFAKRRSPLNHVTAIYRKSIIQQVGGYPALRKAQDHALWSTLIVKGYRLTNIDDVLAYVRAGEGLIERRGWSYFKNEYQLLKYQEKIGFLSNTDFLINLGLRASLRLAPKSIKRWAYRLVRERV